MVLMKFCMIYIYMDIYFFLVVNDDIDELVRYKRS